MSLVRAALSLLCLTFISEAFAQHVPSGAGHAHPSATPASPYAGFQQRTIEALSSEQVADLMAGRGISLALAAELNGYPGPSHTLELAGQLHLSAAQKARTQVAFETMKNEATAIGLRIVAGEMELDRLFAGKTATREAIAAATVKIAVAQGELRASHLLHHIAMMEILSPAQVAMYATLRGYKLGGWESPIRP